MGTAEANPYHRSSNGGAVQKSRLVRAPHDERVCVTVYKRDAVEAVRRLAA